MCRMLGVGKCNYCFDNPSNTRSCNFFSDKHIFYKQYTRKKYLKQQWFLDVLNGDTVRNRSPFVRFTITDPETHQITAAGQIPLNSSPTTGQTNTFTNSKI